MDPLLAMIILWPGQWAPRGWMFCQGQVLTIQQNAAVYSLIGTMYGGDAQTNFKLPDFRGRVAVGAGTAATGTVYNLAQAAGVEKVSLTTAQMPPHTHAVSVTVTLNASGEKATTSIPAAPNNTLAAPYDTTNDAPIAGYNGLTPNVPLNMAGAATGTTTIAGSGLPTPVMQPFLSMNYMIAVQGLYPDRP